MVEAATNQITGNVGEFVKHWCSDGVGVKEHRLSRSRTREAVKEVLRTAPRLWTLSLLKKTFILVHEVWFRKCVTDAFVSVHNCLVGHILDDRHVSLLGVPTQSFKGYNKE